MADINVEDSILLTIKHMLGGAAENSDHFDTDIKVLINSALTNLYQLGVGPQNGFVVKDETATWDQLLIDHKNIESVKEYIYIKVRLTFDTSGLSSSVIEALKQINKENEWRIMIGADVNIMGDEVE